MAKSFFAVSLFFAVRLRVADGKELLCRQLADGKELADGKLADSSSVIWKINSHSIQVIVVLRQSEHMLNDWDFLP